MAHKQPPSSHEDLVKALSRAGVPQSILFYIVLGAISGARKLLMKAANAGCPPEESKPTSPSPKLT